MNESMEPGATEAATPEGAESLTSSPQRGDSKIDGQPMADIHITAAMMEEEQKMSEETEADMARLREQHEKSCASMDADLRAVRYQRLKYLLSKSNMYTMYLVNRIKDQEQEQVKNQARQETRKQNRAAKAAFPKEVLRSSRVAAKNNNIMEPAKPVKRKRKSAGGQSAKKKKKQVLSDESDEEELKQEQLSQETIENGENIPGGADKSADESEETSDEKPDSQETSDEKQDSQETSNEKQDSQETSDEIEQPLLLTGGKLRDYQLRGYKWLKTIYENGINGILADEMGLGKTIQCIASIADMCMSGVLGPFLVVAPLSTVPNWVAEFRRFTPDLPCILYHGTKDERALLRRKIRKHYPVRPGVKIQPVVVTSYEVAMNDRATLADYPWKYLIVDEGHRIKNAQCKLIKQLKMYSSTHRLLLTGTPLQNNLAELWSLLNFLLPDIFDKSSFEMWFDVASLNKSENYNKIVQEEQHTHVLSMLHQILRPFMLRRMKCDVDLDIPPKSEVIVYAHLTLTQSTLYKSSLDGTIVNLLNPEKVEAEQMENLGRGKRATKTIDYVSMCENNQEGDLMEWCNSMARTISKSACITKKATNKTAEIHLQLRNKLMLMRKICNHPYLVEYPLTSEGQYRIDEQLIAASGKMKVLDQLLTELIKRGHKTLIFSQMTSMLDIIGDYLHYRGLNFSRLDGSMHVLDRGEEIDKFNGDIAVPVFLLSTRAGGLGLNLVSADTVIIFDSDWNPQCDLQAQDRCHRIGQTKPVMIYRLITAKTIDQKIVERAVSKRILEKMVIAKGHFKKGLKNFTTDTTEINADMLKDLLESRDHDQQLDVHGEDGKDAINQNDLQMLLSRDHLYARWRASIKSAAKDEPALENNDEDRKVKGVFCTVKCDK